MRSVSLIPKSSPADEASRKLSISLSLGWITGLLVVVCLAAALPAHAVAPQVFVDETAIRLPVRIDNTYKCDFFDADGDGDPDIFCVDNRQQKNTLWMNDGSGVFADESAARLPLGGGSGKASLRFDSGDVDGDGDLDLLIANLPSSTAGMTNDLWLNDGSGFFSDASDQLGELEEIEAFETVTSGGLTVIDGVVFVSFVPPALEITGALGSATLAAPLGAAVEFSIELDAADTYSLDLDLETSPAYGQWQVAVDGMPVGAPIDMYSAFTQMAVASVGPIALGAGSHTVSLTLTGQNASATDNLFLIDAITFSGLAGSQRVDLGGTSSSREADLVDFDNDGDLDAHIGNNNYPNRLLINDGTGVFTDQTAARLTPTLGATHNVEFADFDGDGDLDGLVLNESAGVLTGPNELFLNDGFGNSLGDPVAATAAAGLNADPDSSHGGVVADLDGDGNLDIAIALRDDAQNLLFLGDGTGNFVDATGNLPVALNQSNEMEAGDIDGDGDLDLIVSNGNPNVGGVALDQLLINDGSGVFTDEAAIRGLPLIATANAYGAFADVDGDGDLDLLIASDAGQNQLLINVGPEEPETQLDGLCTFIQSLPDDAFKAPASNRKNALCNKLAAVRRQVEAGAFRGAVRHLERDVRSKMDSSDGGRAKDDWITDETVQAIVLARVDNLIATILAL